MEQATCVEVSLDGTTYVLSVNPDQLRHRHAGDLITALIVEADHKREHLEG